MNMRVALGLFRLFLFPVLVLAQSGPSPTGGSPVSPPVFKLTAGSGISLSPSTGIGNVTVTATTGAGLPSQTGNSGKVLTTDGSAASWTATLATAVQDNITRLGTITSGVWSGTAIVDAKIASALTGKTYNGLTITTTTGTFTLSSGKTFAVTENLTLSGTSGTTMTFPATSAAIARTDAAQTFTGTQTMATAIITGTAAGTFIIGDTAVQDELFQIASNSDSAGIGLRNYGTGGKRWFIATTGGNSGYGQGRFVVGDETVGVALNISGALTSSTATFTGSVATGAPTEGSAGAWKLGALVTSTGLLVSTTQAVRINIGGTDYSLAVLTTNP